MSGFVVEDARFQKIRPFAGRTYRRAAIPLYFAARKMQQTVCGHVSIIMDIAHRYVAKFRVTILAARRRIQFRSIVGNLGKAISQLDWFPVFQIFGLLSLVLGTLAVGDPVGWEHILLAGGLCALFGPGVLGTFRRREAASSKGECRSAKRTLTSGLPTGHVRHAGKQTVCKSTRSGAIEQLTEGWQFGLESLKDIEWELRDNEARYRDLLDSQTDIILRQNQDGALIFVNRAFCRAFDVSTNEVIGRSFTPDVLANGEEEEFERADTPEPEGTAPLRRRFTQLISTVSGLRWITWEEQSIRSGETGALETQRIGRDITEQRKVEATLNQARREAEAASEAKSRFLAVMSHEIRTPLGGIMGMTGLLEGTRLSAEQMTYATAVKDSAKSLLGIIDEILDFSKIEAGKITFEQQPFELSVLLQGIAELLAPRAWDKGLELAWDIAPDLPQTVIGDEQRVRQILMNLVGNAIKFTRKGGVRLSVRRIDADTLSDQGADGRLCSPVKISFAVMDTGIGLSDEQRERIFTEFEQADTTTTRRFGGTGLGLTISRRLARSMNGDIIIRSQRHSEKLTPKGAPSGVVSATFSGSTFELTLPLEQAVGSQLQCAGWPDANNGKVQSPRQILMTGDRSIEADAIGDTLMSLGHHVTFALSEDAVAVFRRETKNGRNFDAIISDTSTYAGIRRKLCKLLKASSNEGAKPRALVIIEPSDRERLSSFREEGFSAYLMRPVRPSSLLSQLAGTGTSPTQVHSSMNNHAKEKKALAVCGSQGTQMHPEKGCLNTEPRDQQHARTRILLAEDNPINALLAKRILQDMGHSVVHVENGAEAVEAIAQSGHEAQDDFDIVLMDLHMPELDGIAACQRIHKENVTDQTDDKRRTAVPPIIALTANAFAEDRRRCLEAGMSDFVTKPFEREHLAQVIDKWCHGRTTETGDGSLSEVG